MASTDMRDSFRVRSYDTEQGFEMGVAFMLASATYSNDRVSVLIQRGAADALLRQSAYNKWHT